tara:strand:- start:1135 stop:1248 length:114 start_codon:yes stop_codon:yes gene_type:complete
MLHGNNDFIKNRVIYCNLVNVRFDKYDDEDIKIVDGV